MQREREREIERKSKSERERKRVIEPRCFWNILMFPYRKSSRSRSESHLS